LRRTFCRAALKAATSFLLLLLLVVVVVLLLVLLPLQLLGPPSPLPGLLLQMFRRLTSMCSCFRAASSAGAWLPSPSPPVLPTAAAIGDPMRPSPAVLAPSALFCSRPELLGLWGAGWPSTKGTRGLLKQGRSNPSGVV
jgi:hypothetical protein